MGPLLSLVFRTEDVWQRYNQLPKRFGALNQGFPFSPLQCRQGRTRMDEGAAMCTMLCMQWLCCVLVVGKVWRIVPCVYKIYMLDRFQFHGLLRNSRDL